VEVETRREVHAHGSAMAMTPLAGLASPGAAIIHARYVSSYIPIVMANLQHDNTLEVFVRLLEMLLYSRFTANLSRVLYNKEANNKKLRYLMPPFEHELLLRLVASFLPFPLLLNSTHIFRTFIGRIRISC
jgi:hypothetical protein